MKILRIGLALIPFFVTSCQGYRSTFDCAPGRGVPCTSLTDIESMIVESEEGPNIFLGSETNRKAECTGGLSLKPKPHRVWITKKVDASGECLQGFYLYLDPECN